MESTARIVTLGAAILVVAILLRLTLGPTPIAASYASAKLGLPAGSFTAPIEMASRDPQKPHLAD
jgi:hypothetical protein